MRRQSLQRPLVQRDSESWLHLEKESVNPYMHAKGSAVNGTATEICKPLEVTSKNPVYIYSTHPIS